MRITSGGIVESKAVTKLCFGEREAVRRNGPTESNGRRGALGHRVVSLQKGSCGWLEK